MVTTVLVAPASVRTDPVSAPGAQDRRNSEAYIPAQQASPGQEARFPTPDVGPRRSVDHQESPPQGSPEALGLSVAVVERLTRRAQFNHLRAHATTQRVGRLRVSTAPPLEEIGPSSAAMGFAVPRGYGSAVRRNRVRRRLREAARAIESEGVLPQCWILVGVMPSRREPSFGQLREWLAEALGVAAEQAPAAQ